MELKEFFDREIVPCVRADGGWLELTGEEGDSVTRMFCGLETKLK